jgi:hypothetical protein
MRKTQLDPKILNWLKKRLKGKVSEHTIRPAISKIARKNPSFTLNAAAEVFAQKHKESVRRFLTPEDRETLGNLKMKEISVTPSRPRSRQETTVIAKYDTTDRLLTAHLDEINKTYTCHCYTATFILCRKVLENLIVHHILKRKYPRKSREHRQKYYDFERNRSLDFAALLSNLRDSASDFVTEKDLVERICTLASGFKETANDMAHSLYHVARKSEIDEKNFQQILDLIAMLEKSIA